jgi:hypothetical protein
MYRQLMLWDMTVDIAAKLLSEKKNKVKVFYHFRGTPLFMR